MERKRHKTDNPMTGMASQNKSKSRCRFGTSVGLARFCWLTLVLATKQDAPYAGPGISPVRPQSRPHRRQWVPQISITLRR